jgi:nucleotide-binding universal stress UspA family protein
MRHGRPEPTLTETKEASMRDQLETREIVIGTDGSAGAALAVEQGVWLAKMLSAQATFVSVAREPSLVLGEPYYQRALTADLAKARSAIADAVLFAEERQVTYESEILEGSPAEKILEVARAHGAAMIVVGCRGRGAVTGAVLGSVSSDVVHRADRPVLVARPAAGVPVGFASTLAV